MILNEIILNAMKRYDLIEGSLEGKTSNNMDRWNSKVSKKFRQAESQKGEDKTWRR